MEKQDYIILLQEKVKDLHLLLQMIADGQSETSSLAYSMLTDKVDQFQKRVQEFVRYQENSINRISERPVDLFGDPIPVKEPVRPVSILQPRERQTESIDFQPSISVERAVPFEKPNFIKELSLGDRFRFQKEIFLNNAEFLEGTLEHLCEFHSMDKAIEFMKNNYPAALESEAWEEFECWLSNRYKS